MWSFTRVWGAWLALAGGSFAVIEVAALISGDKPGNPRTASANARRTLGIEIPARRTRWCIGAGAFFGWLIAHIAHQP